jgi:M6 family metalloprotease-like protein
MAARALALALGLFALSTPGLAQDRFAPDWERPGFDFSRDGAWRVKSRAVSGVRARLRAAGDFGALNAPVALRAPQPAAQAAVSGILYVPTVLFQYQDTDPSAARDPSLYDQLLFATTPPFARPYSLRGYYQELSNNLFSIQGQSIGWVRLDSNEVTYTGTPGSCYGPYGNCNGIFSVDAVLRMQRGLREALAKTDGAVDFRQFDNDGPDGTPNSGDDDGYVDILTFVHATQDGACGGATNNHLWAHRFVLVDTAGGSYVYRDYVTDDPSARGGSIRVRDYILQSGLGGDTGCDSTAIMPIGIMAHELGHALDLPDLYSTDSRGAGIGQWGLMGSGSWTSQYSPARMEAWSLADLGWVTVRPLTVSGDYTLGPAPASDTALLVVPLGSNPRGEYFLVENRQRAAADTALIRIHCEKSGNPPNCGGGLLILHIDSVAIAEGRPYNTVNGHSRSIWGVRVVEADGLDQLRCCRGHRGDAGDVYPGTSDNTVLSSYSSPPARKNLGYSPVGFTIEEVQILSPDGPASLRLTFDAVLAFLSDTTRPVAALGVPYADTLRASGGDGVYDWTLPSGGPPAGLTLSFSGVVSGTPQACGRFAYQAQVTSGAQTLTRTLTVAVTAPGLDTAIVVEQLLLANGALTTDEVTCLDQLGNGNGRFDVGDVRAWLRATGGAAVGSRRQVAVLRRDGR